MYRLADLKPSYKMGDTQQQMLTRQPVPKADVHCRNRAFDIGVEAIAAVADVAHSQRTTSTSPVTPRQQKESDRDNKKKA